MSRDISNILYIWNIYFCSVCMRRSEKNATNYFIMMLLVSSKSTNIGRGGLWIKRHGDIPASNIFTSTYRYRSNRNNNNGNYSYECYTIQYNTATATVSTHSLLVSLALARCLSFFLFCLLPVCLHVSLLCIHITAI